MVPPFFSQFLKVCLPAILCIWCLIPASSALAQGARDKAVDLSAVVNVSPPQITVSWLPSAWEITAQRLYRRLKGASSWGSPITLTTTATSYVDSTVQVGVSYEYFVYRVFNGGPGSAMGYLSAGIRLPLVESRGRVILLVDDTMATPLAAELAQFQQDLVGDGWTVVREDVSRTATPPVVRARVQARQAQDTTNTRALILFGHVPVPYSGLIAPDGHTDHRGAWPADVYYADVNGAWTDTTVNDASAARAENRNVPGDGKFDSSTLSTQQSVELETGRIDLANLPGAPTSEVELLRRYLQRDHAYRFNTGDYADVPRRGLVVDNFGYFNGEAFAASGWRNFAAFFGAGAVFQGSWFGQLPTERYLWAYGCGPGSYQSAGGIGGSGDFYTTPSKAVFTMLFGSYLGDWDVGDSFLRAPLAGPAGSLGLTSCWAGRPHWFLHPMTLGETIGYGAKLTQNNNGSLSSSYLPGDLVRYVHIGLMGDPTLRLHTVSPPANPVAVMASNAVSLKWQPSPDASVEGYLISRGTSAAGPFSKITSSLVTGTSYTDTAATPGQGYVYMLRAAKLEASGGGTYYNSSQGLFLTGTAGVAVPPAPEISVTGTDFYPISNGDSSGNPANGTDFGGVRMLAAPLAHTFTLLNSGSATLQLTGASRVQISGTNAADFSVAAQPPATLAPGASAPVQISFQPGNVGPRAATVTILSNDTDEGVFTFVLTGTGLPALPDISVAPLTLTPVLASGVSGTAGFTINNGGDGTLHYSVASSFGSHAFRDSASFGGPKYSWVEISNIGTVVGGFADTDDALSDPIPVGFAFPFYGNFFSSVRVCTNGFLSFTDTGTTASNMLLPSLGAPANLVAAYWDDLVLDATSRIYAANVGSSFIVEFQNMAFFGDTTGRHITFQIVLKPSGAIVFQYKDIAATSDPYTVGIQDGARLDGLLVAASTSYLQSSMAIQITPPGFYSWLSPGSSSGNVAPHGVLSTTALLNTSALSPGDYYGELRVTSDDPDTPTETVAVRLTVITPRQSWRWLHFQTLGNTGLAADDADPDGDGFTNGDEYAFGGNPNISDLGALVQVSQGPNGYLRIQFNRDATHTDLDYVVEAYPDFESAPIVLATSTAGGPITALAAHSAVETGSGNVKAVTVEDAVLMNSKPARFIHVRAVPTATTSP